MRKPSLSKWATTSFLLSVCFCEVVAVAQTKPPVPDDYQEYFVHYVDNRSIWDKALNLIDVESKDIGRSFALVAGISHYPNMPRTQADLKPAAVDIRNIQLYLKNYEFFDEIVVLTGSDVNLDNLQYFLQTYFPERLKQFPKSRFLFSYSGHGMTEWPKGYLLKSTAQSLTDKRNSVNLDVVRIFVDEVVQTGHHVLVLVNACYSGAFLKRGSSFGGSKEFIPRNPGAHAITAGGTGELTWHIPQVGEGSVFFEKVFAGLDGRADTSPEDGAINVYELFAYLKGEVQVSTDQQQNPQIGDISKHGSKGEFFFLNRDRQVSNGVLPAWSANVGTRFGTETDTLLWQGEGYRKKREYHLAFDYLGRAAEEGIAEAMYQLGTMHRDGLGIEPNTIKAMAWFQKAADAGNVSAMGDLYALYIVRDTEEDLQIALYWLQQAKNMGNVDAMTLLAQHYRKGRGVPKNDYTAYQLAKRAADAGHSLAMQMVGLMYEFGEAVPESYLEAINYYRKSAAAGNTSAAKFVEEGDYDLAAQELIEQIQSEFHTEVQLTSDQLTTLKKIIKDYGPYWGRAYFGLMFTEVGLVVTDTETSMQNTLSLLDVGGQVWSGRNLNERMQLKTTFGALTELANLIRSQPMPLDRYGIHSVREQSLKRPDLFILDEYSSDLPMLPPFDWQ